MGLRSMVKFSTAMFLAAAYFNSPVVADELKLASINMEKAFDGLVETKDFSDEIQETLKGYNQKLADQMAKVKALGVEVNQLKQEQSKAEETKTPMDPKKAKRLNEALMEFSLQMEAYRTTAKLYQDDIKTQADDFGAKVHKAMSQGAEELRAKGKYRLVFDASASGIMASTDVDDLTEALVTALNEKYKASKAAKK